MYVCEINGLTVRIEGDDRLFSPRHGDRGTLAMLKHACLEKGQKVLDLGCGCGIVGIYAGMVCGQEGVILSDIDPIAVEVSRRNAALNGLALKCTVSDGFDGINEAGFDVILSNPPYQTDFAVAKRFIEKGFNRLKIGGTLYMVTKRRPWYENKLRAVFGGCRVSCEDGYYVFCAERRSAERGRVGSACSRLRTGKENG